MKRLFFDPPFGRNDAFSSRFDKLSDQRGR